jgi:hypothetical protein
MAPVTAVEPLCANAEVAVKTRIAIVEICSFIGNLL